WSALVFSLVALVHSLLSSSGYEWLWGGLIVSGVFLLLGGLFGQAGYKRLKSCRPAPSRTLRVLGQDRVWIKDEARPAGPIRFDALQWTNWKPGLPLSGSVFTTT